MSCSREADECMIDILTFFSAIFHVVLLAACLCNLSMIPIFITSSIITILPQKRRTATMALRMSICTSTKRPFSRPSRGTRHAFIVSLHARNALARLVRVSRVVRAFRSSVNGRHTQSGQRSGIANERSECCISRQCVLLLSVCLSEAWSESMFHPICFVCAVCSCNRDIRRPALSSPNAYALPVRAPTCPHRPSHPRSQPRPPLLASLYR